LIGPALRGEEKSQKIVFERGEEKEKKRDANVLI